VGGSRDVAVDIRVIAATNERLDEAVARGSFRTDLYHRLDEFSLRMPELREIPADIPLFAEFFLDQANRELGRRVVGFDAGALAALAGCNWPGNLRQLKNAVNYATLLCEGDYITRRELPREVVDTPPRTGGRRGQQVAGGQAAGHRPQDTLQQAAALRHRVSRPGCRRPPHSPAPGTHTPPRAASRRIFFQRP